MSTADYPHPESLIVPEHQITVLEAAPYRGVLTVKTQQGEVSLGYNVARQILVVPGADSGPLL